MSTISLDIETLKNIKTEIDIKTDLLQNNYLSDINNELSLIKNNIQGEEIHTVINKISDHLNTINSNISQETSKLNDFLESQLKNYQKTEEELDEELLNIINKMRVLTGKEPFTEGFLAYAQTFLSSSILKSLDLSIEGVIDAHIYGTSKILQLFGLDDKWAEDIISYEVIDYDKWVSNVSPNIAYGKAHSIGNTVGTFGGYMATSAIPVVGTALCAFAGAGSKAEDSINEQKASGGEVNDLKVFGDSLVGSAEGYSVAQMSSVFGKGKSFTNLKNSATAAGATGGKQVASKVVGTAVKSGLPGAKQVIKETPKYIARDSRTWITAGANDTQQALSKIGGYEEKNNIGNVITTALPNMGAAGIDVISNLMK